VWGTLISSGASAETGSDCWCQLSAQNNQRIVLSIISYEFNTDPMCRTGGLFLQASRNRSDECTQLQKGHYYISSTKELFINFYVKAEVGRGSDDLRPGSFWIVYEGEAITSYKNVFVI